MSTSTWTTADIPSQRGKLALVTGANSGIGYQTALELARAGAAVILAGRSASSIADAASAVAREVPSAELIPLQLDLADLTSVSDAAGKVLSHGRPLDLLINNAGVMAVPERRTTKDGFELTFGTNHLGHFALTGHLLPALLGADASRVVTVSARVARSRGTTFDDVASERKYTPMGAYTKSKLANVVFTQELVRRAGGTSLSAVAVHPGAAMTGIQRHVPRVVKAIVSGVIQPLMMQAPDQAALPSLFAATDPAVSAGDFVAPTGPMEGRGTPGIVALPPAAADRATAKDLWELSERLTHVTYTFQ
ncbi:oxidoreductase [Streptomyces sp. NPDC087420]|uniref:oxidoreductase n=1 Tax=Streptomyces sp. NPDC087420 TaxID=3365785 RepID=UPI0038356F03